MDHIDIINKIVEAERTAQRIADEARSRLASLDSDLAAERYKMRAQYFERADRRIASVMEREGALADEMIAELDEKLEQELKSVERLAREQNENWVGTIFSMIVGR